MAHYLFVYPQWEAGHRRCALTRYEALDEVVGKILAGGYDEYEVYKVAGHYTQKRDPEATLEELTGKLTAVLGAEV
jgi:hypothetical protein